MSQHNGYDRNNAAYQQLKGTIDRTYPKGWFVGIDDDQIVGTAATFPELERLLREGGYDPRKILVVEAGVVYPDHVTIFM